MLYDKKVQFNLNSDFHYEPQADAASDTTDNNSIFITNCVQDAQNTDSMYDISNSEYIDGDIKESVDNSANSLSQTHGLQDYSENVLLIKQLEAEIAKMESEYQADQKGEGIAGAAIWEIGEFTVDVVTGLDVQRNLFSEWEIFGRDWQNPGLKDTMNDMIIGSIGSLAGTIILLVSGKGRKKSIAS